ncbi:MAG: PadR family transcriptional regulator [Desulfobacteraceae bacterium]|jgi:DNA-binding PadR family transcriptional regulator
MKKTRPTTEYALLGAIMCGPEYGYEIMQFLKASLASIWYVSPSQLYTLLRKLERQGLLRSAIETQETRPSKRVFSLTAAGEKSFLAWLHSPTAHVRDLRIEFLAKLFFFHHLSLKGANELVEAQIMHLQKLRGRIQKKGERERNPYEKLVLRFRLRTLDAWCRWLIEEAKPFMFLSDEHSDQAPPRP